ncbi:DUF6107 family protein [Rhizobium sp. EC-SD404]|uniref:DUF6107 family protein n=1 Tax=Rhizobium sp. EC-SD404 TaxID=2038389 RepID=UPI0012563908|nr:DUF6107 family protein [Rhizobium sp. EC-SD404]VVT14113.1 conserved membrane hypothetical protein [Rhizobium sp. EC-SD404]
MTDLMQDIGLLLAKGLGAIAGAIISLIYLLPKSRREAAGRFFIGVVSGMIFGGAVGVALSDWLAIGSRLTSIEITLMGSAAASLCAWWALGVLARLAERWK